MNKLHPFTSFCMRAKSRPAQRSPRVNLSQPFQKSRTPSLDLFGDLPESDSPKSSSSRLPVNNGDPDTTGLKGEKRKHGEEEIKSAKRKLTGLYEVKSFCAERKGEREEMQDSHVMIDSFTEQVDSLHEDVCRLAFYAVYDGHGGERASRFAAQHLHKHLADRLPKGNLAKIEAEMKKLLIDTYKKTDEEFLKQATKQKPSWKDGTTATTALLLNNTLYVADVGDSKAVVCRRQKQQQGEGDNGDRDGEEPARYVGLPLTKEHNPSQYEERMRIQKAGGQVREGRVMGVLEVSRSLGDGPYKRHGVSCIPDVKRCQLTDNDRFLLIACDGLWKCFTNDAAIELVNRTLQDESIKGSEQKSAEDTRWETACHTLANEAVRRLSADNVTVILIRIGQKHL